MNEFCITCANGIEYNSFEDFIDNGYELQEYNKEDY
jgi:hypothetical protein